VLLSVKPGELEQASDNLGGLGSQGTSERRPQEDHAPKAFCDRARSRAWIPLLSVNENLRGDKPPQAVRNEDDGAVRLVLVSGQFCSPNGSFDTMPLTVLERAAANLEQTSSASLCISVLETLD
jgi:hypothetical protein